MNITLATNYQFNQFDYNYLKMSRKVTLNSFLKDSNQCQQFWAVLKASFSLGPVEDLCGSSSKCHHQHSFIIPTPNKNNIFCWDDVKEIPSASTI